jgi:hypothetical protein
LAQPLHYAFSVCDSPTIDFKGEKAMASTTYYLVPDMQKAVQSGAIKESNSTFECPAGMVMIGRQHQGDENGNTFYQSAPLILDPNTHQTGTVTLSAPSNWIDAGKQSALSYKAPNGYVITGRKHDGDENGQTYFKISQVLIGNTLSNTVDEAVSGSIKESSGTWYNTPSISTMKGAITGMSHSGDENGNSTYTSNLVFYAG